MHQRLGFLLLSVTIATTGLSSACAETLTINGRVTTAACSLNVPVLNMGDVPITEFGGKPWVASQYEKYFDITLQGCVMSTLNSAALKFQGNTVSGYPHMLNLTQTSNAAKGMGIRLEVKDENHTSYPTKDIYFDGSKTYPFNVESGIPAMHFKAYFYKIPSTDVLKAGDANATATVTLIYS